MTTRTRSEVVPEILEHVSCDICGADDAEPALTLRDHIFETTDREFRLVRCRRCDALYLNPRPVLDQVGRYYRDDYAPFARSGVAAAVKGWSLRREVRALWPLLASPRRVLDVGCATGELLQAVRERGNPNVVGVEPSAHAAAIARERWGIDVLTGTLQDARLPTASVNTALMAHTVEHLPSPRQTLIELNRILKLGGTVVFWLPNADSIAARALGEWWIGYDAPRHLQTFTSRSISNLLRQSGFEVRRVDHEWIGLEWAWALRLYAREWRRSPSIDRALAALHPALTGALTPAAAAAALARKAGRIRVVAVKRPCLTGTS